MKERLEYLILNIAAWWYRLRMRVAWWLLPEGIDKELCRQCLKWAAEKPGFTFSWVFGRVERNLYTSDTPILDRIKRTYEFAGPFHEFSVPRIEVKEKP